jgi:hypothetical protein
MEQLVKTTKKCYMCHQVFPLDCFYKNKNRPGGFAAACKVCTERERTARHIYHPEIRKQQWKNWKTNNYRHVWSYMSLYHHARKGYEINVTPSDLEGIANITEVCYICGIILDWSYGPKKGILNDNSPTLDRVNNEEELNIDNIKIICYKCNRTKSDRTMNEFIEYCGMVYTRFRKSHGFEGPTFTESMKKVDEVKV